MESIISFFPFSFSLSLTHTHTHTHTHTRLSPLYLPMFARSHFIIVSCPFFIRYPSSHCFPFPFLFLSISLSHTHTHTHTHVFPPSIRLSSFAVILLLCPVPFPLGIHRLMFPLFYSPPRLPSHSSLYCVLFFPHLVFISCRLFFLFHFSFSCVLFFLQDISFLFISLPPRLPVFLCIRF